MDKSGRTLDIVNGVDAVDMKDILDGVDAVDGVDVMDSVGNSASTNFLPKQISSSLSSGLSVGSVKVFLHASRRQCSTISIYADKASQCAKRVDSCHTCPSNPRFCGLPI